jgi:hypothetical protein
MEEPMGHFGNGMPIPSSSSHFTYFFKGAWPSFTGSIYYPQPSWNVELQLLRHLSLVSSKMIILFF